MLARLKTVINKLTDSGPDYALAQGEIRMAAVMLLVEVMMADHQIEDSEKHQLLESTMQLAQLSREESLQLIEEARQKHDDLVSLYDITSVINRHFDQERRIELISHMWRVAYSDKQWDKYEEHIIRKVADLLYISHKDFIHARLKAQDALSS